MRVPLGFRDATVRHPWFLVLAVLAFCAWRPAHAQVPLPDPDLDLIGNGRVWAMLRQPDGSLIIGGDFQSINGIPRRNLARLLPAGTLDMAWDPSPDNWAMTLARAPNGDIYVGGYFHNIGGFERPGFARLDAATGAVDAGWVPAVADSVVSVVVDSDGSVLAIPFGSSNSATIVKLSGSDGSGLPWAHAFERADYLVLDGHGALYSAARQFDFDFPGSTYRTTITKRVAASGEPDAQWSANLPGPPDAMLEALVVDDNAVYVGGSFGLRKFSAATGQDVAGWNAPSARIAAVAIDGPGHLIVGGSFESIHGQPRSHLARVSSTTGLPTPAWNASADGPVDQIRIDSDGSVEIGGYFQSVNQQQRIGFAQLLADTTLEPSRTDVESPAKAYVVVAQDDGGVVVGGPFHRVGTSAHRNILRLHANGTLDDAWTPSLPSMPWILAAAPDGSVYAAMNRWIGDAQDPSYASRLARIDGKGHLAPAWSVTADDWIHAMKVASDGSVFVGGAFATIAGMHRQALAKIDSKSGIPFPAWDAQIDCCAVRALATDSTDDLFIGGTFQSVGGQSHPYIAKVSAATAITDEQWHPAINGYVYAFARDAAGPLYVGGSFWSVGDVPNLHVAKVMPDGTGALVPGWHPTFCAGNSFNWMYYAVSSLAVDGNGTVYAGGYFCGAPGSYQYERGLARLSGESGLIDESWAPLPWYAQPYSIAVSQSGAVHVAGNFEQAGGLPRSGIAAFAPTLPDWLFIDGFDRQIP
jgi:hypothetical protein